MAWIYPHLIIGKLKCLLISSLLVTICSFAAAQDCNIPILNGFTNADTQGFEVHWQDDNFDPVYWEIEFGLKGFVRDQVPEITNIQQKFYSFNGLMSGFTYEIYLRAVCEDDQVSDWNGPYFFSTVIDNDTSCGLNLDIQDNNCPSENQFSILIEGYDNKIISQEFSLDFIDIILSHSWPPDLSLSIISPSGSRAILASHVGNGSDNYGDPSVPSCSGVLKFTNNSCTKIQNAIPPLLNELRPMEDFNEIFQGEIINGIWKIAICDNAIDDVGSLNYIHLSFAEIECPQVRNFKIMDIESDHVFVRWDNSITCNDVRLEYRRKEDPITETFIEYVPCDRGEFIITELEPSSDYILNVFSECSEELESLPLCELSYTTTCRNSSFSSDFESETACFSPCVDSCLGDKIWHNILNDDNNWQINSGSTQSKFTGPLSSLRGCGSYIYTESSVLCNSVSSPLAILESTCLEINEQSACHLSFYYSARAINTSSLALQIRNNNDDWIELWKSNGGTNAEWKFEQIEIADQMSHFQLRFITNEVGTRGKADFALDQIKLIAIDTISYSKYFRDEDQDGFGIRSDSIFACSNIPPLGYSENYLDCDDTESLVNPLSAEINCNGVDDNCNGIDDDVESGQLEYHLIESGDPSCEGKVDGFIDIEVVTSLQGISYLWSNNSITEDISGLSSGVYICTISTNSGCSIITDPIFIEANKEIEYLIEAIQMPNCSTSSKGSISLEVTGGTSPYSIIWSNGMQGPVISNLESGTYNAIITDNNNCSLKTIDFILQSEPVLTVGIISKKDLNCFNSNDGLIRVGAFGGTTPYKFLWQDGLTGSLRNQLQSGNYSVTITDANNCEAIISDIILTEPDDLEIEVLSIDHITCHGGFDSYIDTYVIGGTQPYSYLWSDGSTKSSLTNKKSGLYSLTVTDLNSCSSILTDVEIREEDPLVIELDSINNLRCIGSDNGYISVNVNGGVSPYKYNWSLNEGQSTTNSFIDNLESGRYALTVEDFNGCKSKVRRYDVINNNQPINISLLVGDSLDCHDDANGTLIAVSNNGALPLDYNWSAGRQVVRSMFSDTINNLVFGKYNLTITDSEGCVGVSDSILLENPEELRFELDSKSNVSCFDQSDGLIELEVFGGILPHNITWSNGMTGRLINGLSPGEYSATITDRNNCLLITSDFTIGQPDSLSISVDVINDDGMMNGQINLDVSGGTSPYSYLWDENNGGIYNDSLASDLSSGIYNVTIFDSKLCEKQLLITVDFISGLNVESELVDFRLYPNPTLGEINYSIPDNLDLVEVRLFGTDGQLIQAWSKDELPKQIDLRQIGDLREGVYLANFNFSNFSITHKVLFFHSF